MATALNNLTSLILLPLTAALLGALTASATNLPLNTWTHLAGTYAGTTLNLYGNGVRVSSRAQTAPIQTSTGALTIGGDSRYGQFLAGRIDEVRVYNRALSVTEIQTDLKLAIAPVPWRGLEVGTDAYLRE